METKDPQTIGACTQERFQVNLKFKRSEQDKNSLFALVSQNTMNGKLMGRCKDDRFPKKIVIADPRLNYLIMPGVLYRSTIVPMKEKDGYIAISVTPYQFQAHIHINYVPKAVYQVVVSFGNRNIVFDPKDGKKRCVKSLAGVLEVLSKRLDIENLADVIADFESSAATLLEFMKKDGFYVKTA